MWEYIKTKLSELVSPPSQPQYRIVKENEYNQVLLEIITFYWIEKKSNINWYQMGPKFESYDAAIKYHTRLQEYLKQTELNYTYL